MTHDQDFVQLSVQLAHEYVKLGKLREAGVVYKRSLNPMQIQTVSSDTRVVLLLRHAESLTKLGDVDQRSFIRCFYCHTLTPQLALLYTMRPYNYLKLCQ